MKVINLILSNGTIVLGELVDIDEKNGNIKLNKPIIYEGDQFLRDFIAPQINNEKTYFGDHIITKIEVEDKLLIEDYQSASEQLYKLSDGENIMHQSKENLVMLQLSSGFLLMGVLVSDKVKEIQIKYPMRVFLHSDGTNMEVSLSALNPLSLNDSYTINKTSVLSQSTVNNENMENLYSMYSGRVYERPEIIV